MKTLLKIVICLPLVFSCAHQGLERSLKNPSLDGLRHESLTRYTVEALKKLDGLSKKIALCHQGRYNEAFTLFKQSLDQNQNNPVYWNHLGTCYYLKGEYPKSLIYLDISMELNKKPQYKNKKVLASVHNNIGLVHLKQNNLTDAKERFKKAVELHPSSLTPKYNLAQLYLAAALYERAEGLLKSLAKEKPLDVDFNYSLGHLYLMKKNYSKALEHFHNIPKEHARRDDVALNLATTFYFMGKPAQALKILEDAPMKVAEFALQQAELKKRVEKRLEN